MINMNNIRYCQIEYSFDEILTGEKIAVFVNVLVENLLSLFFKFFTLTRKKIIFQLR